MLNQLKTYKNNKLKCPQLRCCSSNRHLVTIAVISIIWIWDLQCRMKAYLSPFGYSGARLSAHGAAGVPTQDNFIHRLRLWSFSSAHSQMKRSTGLWRSRLQRWGTLVPLPSHICIWARASIETYGPKTTDSLRCFSVTSSWAHTHTLSDPETLPVMPGAWKIKTYKLFLH